MQQSLGWDTLEVRRYLSAATPRPPIFCSPPRMRKKSFAQERLLRRLVVFCQLSAGFRFLFSRKRQLSGSLAIRYLLSRIRTVRATQLTTIIGCISMESLDYLALRRIARFLDPEDIVRLGRTCKRMHSVMPRVVLSYEEWRGEDFKIFGPNGGHWSPELYFDAPTFTNTIKKLSLSVVWKDQGWGNRKGELFLKLMRPVSNGKPVEVAEHRGLFGIAGHIETNPRVVIADHPVVRQARPGDFYRFMRNAGGGGGHSLTVKNFRVVATVCKIETSR